MEREAREDHASEQRKKENSQFVLNGGVVQYSLRRNTVSKSEELRESAPPRRWELTLRAAGEKQLQGQHGKIAFGRYEAATGCAEAAQEWETSQRAAGDERDQGHGAT